MKNIYFLLFTLFIFVSSFGQTTLYQESFETPTNGTNYFTSVPEFTDSTVSSGGDFFTRTDGSDITAAYTVAGIDGAFFFGAMDIDGEGATLPVNLTTAPIDITSLTDVDFVILLGEDDDGVNQDWDGADYFHITYSIDGGADQNLLWVESEIAGTNGIPKLDTDFDGIGDGAEITATLTEYSLNIPVSGSSIVFKMEFNLNSGDEDIAIDNIRVVDGFAASPSITVTAPSSGTVFNPGTTGVDVEWTTANLGGSETVNITVNGMLFMGVTSPYAVETADGMTYNITVDLVDGGILDSGMTDFSVGSLTTATDLAAVRADYNTNGPGAFYSLQTTPTVTYARVARNQKYIQDGTAGILIDDDPGTITTTFAEGDGMSGLVGQVTEFSGVMQFNPIQDASVVAGTPVTPEVVTLAQILGNQEAYESELVQINDITFALGDGVNVFASATNYDISDPSARAMSVFRSNFSEADYIGQLIPMGAVSVNTLVGEFNGTAQITSRTVSDLTLSNDEFGSKDFAVYPNPTSTGFVNIKTNSGSTINVQVFDVLGKVVLTQSVENERLDVSSLNNGIYIMKLSQDRNSTTRKLVIK